MPPMPATQDRLPPASEQALGVLLVQDGLLSAAQLLAVQQYGREHNLDLRQAILKLKLLPEARLQGILTDQVPLVQPVASPTILASGPNLPAEAPVDGSPTIPDGAAIVPAPPIDQPLDRTQRERDIRIELK